MKSSGPYKSLDPLPETYPPPCKNTITGRGGSAWVIRISGATSLTIKICGGHNLVNHYLQQEPKLKVDPLASVILSWGQCPLPSLLLLCPLPSFYSTEVTFCRIVSSLHCNSRTHPLPSLLFNRSFRWKLTEKSISKFDFFMLWLLFHSCYNSPIVHCVGSTHPFIIIHRKYLNRPQLVFAHTNFCT